MPIFQSLSDLCTADFNLSTLVAMEQMWIRKRSFLMSHPRPTNALLFFSGCSAVFEAADQSTALDIPQGSLFFIPAGAEYNWIFSNAQAGCASTLLFEFNLTDSLGQAIRIAQAPGILPQSDPERTALLFHAIVAEFAKPAYSPARVKAAAYSLLSAVAGEGRRGMAYGRAACIARGIRYLEEDPLQTLSIREIAELCSVSVNYFERLFREYAGCTPTEYRLQRKMEKAKLLLSNETLNIRQTAAELGFDDCAYFCRVFRKMFGCTPSQYRKVYQSTAGTEHRL